LRSREAELRAAGVVHMSVFGSVARDEASADSDVDLMAEFDRSRRRTLVTMGRLQSDLSDWLGVKVDLSDAGKVAESVRQRVLNEAVIAF
jgi:predicted nucleotidyltransferase